MAGDYSKWYRPGSVSVTKGSKYVTGTDTFWNSAGIKPGDIFSIDNSTQYEVESITDNTHLVLKTAFAGDTTNNVAYYIIRNFNASFGAQAAAQATELYADVKKYIDGKQETLKGKSAYELAVDGGFVGTLDQWRASLKGEPGTNGTNGKSAYELAVAGGYKGTQAEWLESLKADNEWATLDARTQRLTIQNPYRPGPYIRAASLGDEFTAEQAAAIANGTFTNLELGDYWTLTHDFTEMHETLTNEGLELEALSRHSDDTKKKMTLRILDLDYYYHRYTGWHNASDCATRHHLLMGIGSCLATPLRYRVDGLTTPYYNQINRKIWNDHMLPVLENFFGADHIATFPARLCNAWDENNKPSGFVDINAKLEMPTTEMFHGCINPQANPLDYGYDARQARLFIGSGAEFLESTSQFSRQTSMLTSRPLIVSHMTPFAGGGYNMIDEVYYIFCVK